jgi:hypothetical protein
VSVVSSAFAEQLANVQSQLMALSHLPKTIQSTLDEITKQLQSLIPTPKLKQKSVEPESKATNEEKVVTNEGDFSLTFPLTLKLALSLCRMYRCMSARHDKIRLREIYFSFYRS